MFKDKPTFNLNFNYRSAVGKLNYLAQTTRPDIMYATHQLVRLQTVTWRSYPLLGTLLEEDTQPRTQVQA